MTSYNSAALRHSLRRIAAAILLAWAAAITVQQWRAETRAEPAAPLAGASWIWASGPWRWSAAPAAFLAACDFDLAAPAPGARLLLMADEAALFWVNGRLVASSEYRAGGGLGLVALGDRVRVGGNRVVAQLRSGRGPGGLLAAVDPGDGQAVACATGPAWRVFRDAPAGLLAGWAPLDIGEEPVVWGRPPLARWGVGAGGASLPRWDQVLAGAQPVPPLGSRRGRAAGIRTRAAAGQAVDVIFDWGAEVQGILEIVVMKDDVSSPAAGGVTDRPALIRFSAEPPPADGVEAALVIPAGERRWRDAVPRQFRYVRVIGLLGVDRIALLPVPPALVAPPAPPIAGVLGIDPPPLQSAVRGELRRLLRASG